MTQKQLRSCLIGVLAVLCWMSGASASPPAAPGSAGSGSAGRSIQTPAPPPANASPAPAPAPAPAASGVVRPGAKAGGVVGWLELSGELAEEPPPFAWVKSGEGRPRLRDVLAQLRFVAEDQRYLGVVIHLDQPVLHLTQIDQLADAIAAVRKAGKKALVFSEAYDLPTYLLASSADRVLMQHRGIIELAGLSIEEMYLAGLLEKIGLKADMVQVGAYKGAEEPLTRTGPSPQWNQNMDALLDDLYGRLVDRLAANRGMKRADFEKAMTDSWQLDDAELVKRGLIDQSVNRDLTDATAAHFGEEFSWDEDMGRGPEVAPLDNPFALMKLLMESQAPRATRPSLALIHAYGPITSGDSTAGRSPSRAGMFGGPSIGSRTIAEALADAAEDPNIRGIVLRIDSPGGSALASEVIWQALREAGREKPIYVSIGSMAASGGYYMASAGHEIYVSPDSIVGSIGVVGGKIVMGGLYEKIGVGVHRRSRGPLGDVFNSVTPFTPEQRGLIEASMKRVYEQFLDRVRSGRGKRLANAALVAEGRLFSGAQAVRNGMADKLGGVDDCVRALARVVNLEEGRYDVINLPAPLSLAEYLDQVFGDVRAPMSGGSVASLEAAWSLGLFERLSGPGVWPRLSELARGLTMLRDEHVLTLMPAAVIVR